ncbi:uncharacterized protein LOC126579661 [Anopheles aquasalis]|uniref:uncharacterized protein LOC126579661 n=1 Tax=Anopheles aquasalis TaxID=42839 RepID=UPI00215A65A0|nr:uncharacterized protein LOC126579661 [Anopheles aquasalis]XP_050099126.1 uncharacterized protein LOC126579661 [Anopheles aquasalis]XP_050099127.1 uncharacterized protein LOC126579661 [Anopheles aquasalis]
MMTMDVSKPETAPVSATGGGGGGGGGGSGGPGNQGNGSQSGMALNGLVPNGQQQQQQQQQAAQLSTISHQPTNGVGAGGPGPGPGQQQQQQQQPPQVCAGCGKIIQDRFLLRALDLLWHEDCLKCGCCDCRLGEVGSTLYTKGNLMLCKRDYLRLFGNTGFCAACNKVIPAFEMVMRARNNVYHLECFACQQCNHRFCVGDKFYLCENKILCEYDYEERLVFASMANHPMLKRQMSQQGGGGGGSGGGGGGAITGPSQTPQGMQNGHGANGHGGGGGGSQAPGGIHTSPQQQNGVVANGGNPMMGSLLGQQQQQQQQQRQGGPLGSGVTPNNGDLNNNNSSNLPVGLAGGPSPFGSPTHLKSSLNNNNNNNNNNNTASS